MELSRHLRVENVARLNPTAPRQIDVSRSVADAVDLMRRERVGCLLVTRRGELVGIFTERDLLKRVLAVGKPLADPLIEVMTENPASVHINEPIRNAIRTMEEGGYRHLPVVDENNRPVGVLSAKRIVRYLVEHFPALVHNQPTQPQQYPEHAEGA